MPKLKVWDGTPTPQGTVAIRLFQVSDKEVMMAAVDDAGEILSDNTEDHGGGLLTLLDTGHIALSPCVMPQIGFELDSGNRLMLYPWGEQMHIKHQQKYGGKRATFKTVK